MSPSTSAQWRPLTPQAAIGELSDLVAARRGVVRVMIDGAPCAEPGRWAERLVEAVRDTGRPAAHVRAEGFWHDRSLRFEYGREDPDAYLNWLDHKALRREVLDAATDAGAYLPSLRDPVSNRATRATPIALAAETVLVVSGPVLLGLGLPVELAVHLEMSPAARARRTPVEEAWTLPAFEAYDATVDPAALADVVIKVDDARHPAMRGARG